MAIGVDDRAGFVQTKDVNSAYDQVPLVVDTPKYSWGWLKDIFQWAPHKRSRLPRSVHKPQRRLGHFGKTYFAQLKTGQMRAFLEDPTTRVSELPLDDFIEAKNHSLMSLQHLDPRKPDAECQALLTMVDRTEQSSKVLMLGKNSEQVQRSAGLMTRGVEQLTLAQTDLSTLEEDLDAAAASGTRVLNIALNIKGSSDVSSVLSAVDAHRNVLAVSAAGDQAAMVKRVQNDLIGSSRDNLIKVANASENGELARDSNFSATLIDFAASGDGVKTTSANGSLQLTWGSDASAAQVSNLCAKVSLICPSLSASDIKRVLSITADRTPYWSERVTYGVINERFALRLATMIELGKQGLNPEQSVRRMQLHGTYRQYFTLAHEAFQNGGMALDS